jgi:hypothetical protein
MTPFNAFRRPLTVQRKTAGTYEEDGLFVEGVSSTLSIQASVQPANGEALQALPEAQRDLETYTLYTETALHVSSQDLGTTADIVTINGVGFVVQRKAPWQNNIINHNAYLVQKVAQ